MTVLAYDPHVGGDRAAGILATLAIALVPLATWALQSALGWWPPGGAADAQGSGGAFGRGFMTLVLFAVILLARYVFHLAGAWRWIFAASLVLTVYRAKDFDAAVARANEVLAHQGRGHSVGLHTKDMSRARELAEELPVVRVLINFAHTFGNGGGFDSGLEFTLTMGCGSWQKNSISENLNYKHFINITHLVTPIREDKPSEEELFEIGRAHV